MPQIIPNRTTCGYPKCGLEKQTFKPGCYRLSLEPVSGGSDNPFNIVTTTAVSTWTAVSKSPSRAADPANLRGKAVGGIQWFCLPCIEELWAVEDQDETSSVVSSTLTVVLASISKKIFAERRHHASDGAHYKLPLPQAYALEKWKAAIAFLDFFADSDKVADLINRARDTGFIGQWGNDAFVGLREPRLLYESESLRDMRGYTEIGGVRVEAARRHVAGKKLSEILKLVEEKTKQKLETWQAKNQSLRSGTSNISPAITTKAYVRPNGAQCKPTKTASDKRGPRPMKKRRFSTTADLLKAETTPGEATQSWKSAWGSDNTTEPEDDLVVETPPKPKRPEVAVDIERLPPDTPTDYPEGPLLPAWCVPEKELRMDTWLQQVVDNLAPHPSTMYDSILHIWF